MVTDISKRPDRRAAPRFDYFARVVGEYSGSAAPCFEGRIRNLSLNGVGIALHRPLPSGAVIALTLFHAVGIYQCAREARVVDSRSDDLRSWQVNCEFMVPLSPAELHLFEVQDFSQG